jgi:hypothetical protein
MAKRHSKTKDIYSARTVREKPVVIEHEREVEDALRIIERRHFTEDAPGCGLIRHRRNVAEEDVVIQKGGSPAKIERHAKIKREASSRPDAEVTILGPDRMSICLFCKRRGPNGANGEAQWSYSVRGTGAAA